MQVSNRRSRRLVNDRLLMELVPRLNAEEIRGLFAPPPWGIEFFDYAFFSKQILCLLIQKWSLKCPCEVMIFL